MARKPENTFRGAVNRLLPTELHHEKMNNPYSSGTADDWYSGTKADLWVEYKYIQKLPVRAAILPDLSSLQIDWLEGRYREGRNVAVVVGSPAGSVIYRDMSWLEPLSVEEFKSLCITKEELARWLVNETMERADVSQSSTNSSKSRRSRAPRRSSN